MVEAGRPSTADFGRCICCPYISNDSSLTWEAPTLHADYKGNYKGNWPSAWKKLKDHLTRRRYYCCCYWSVAGAVIVVARGSLWDLGKAAQVGC